MPPSVTICYCLSPVPTPPPALVAQQRTGAGSGTCQATHTPAKKWKTPNWRERGGIQQRRRQSGSALSQCQAASGLNLINLQIYCKHCRAQPASAGHHPASRRHSQATRSGWLACLTFMAHSMFRKHWPMMKLHQGGSWSGEQGLSGSQLLLLPRPAAVLLLLLGVPAQALAWLLSPLEAQRIRTHENRKLTVTAAEMPAGRVSRVCMGGRRKGRKKGRGIQAFLKEATLRLQ